MNIVHAQLQTMLTRFRQHRGFNAHSCLKAKTKLVNDYMNASGLSSVVVGVSGGVDSAVVLGMLAHAKKQPGSPIRRIIAALLPYLNSSGTTNQQDATDLGNEVAKHFGAEVALIDLSQSLSTVKKVTDSALCMDGNAWASGQLVSYLRTPVLFYLTSLLTQQGSPGILVGTTNRDEGGYIGYFGKAADAMVDLQLISDLHKSEVFALAQNLGVPKAVIDRAPTGDIYDGRNDEQLIGAPYDFIELYSLYLSMCSAEEQVQLLQSLGEEAQKQFVTWQSRLDILNRQNTHKYLGGSVAVNLDVYERAVPGGWRNEVIPETTRTTPPSVFVNQIELQPAVIERFHTNTPASHVKRKSLPGFGDSAFCVDGLSSEEELGVLLKELNKLEWTPVGQNGMLKGFSLDKDKIGSYRATYFSQRFADLLWARIAPNFPVVRVMDEYTPTDWDGDYVWRAIGISPLMRFIRYTKDGLLVPHYDATYEYSDNKRTLMSVVLYLTENPTEDGGATRFILDSQRHLRLKERHYADWQRLAEDRDILATVQPRAGSALIFDHRILHDSAQLLGDNTKTIMRTDVVFERCGAPRKRLTVSRPLGLPEDKQSGEEPKDVKQKLEAPALADSQKPVGNISAAGTKGDYAALLAKALRDPYYGSAFPTLGSLSALMDAGFFDDGATEADVGTRADFDWFMTPTHKIADRLDATLQDPTATDKPLLVLMSTGGFCPLHHGHIEMMEIARRELESRGAIVLGGYLCPDHDGYVSQKCGEESISSMHRLRLCEEAIRDSDWLMTDGWAALGVERALNFTDIMTRLEGYLSRHVRSHRPIEVVYVFGGDNARFTRTFINRGRCVCVPRPGSDAALTAFSGNNLLGDPNKIVFAKQTSFDVSSRYVRIGQQMEMQHRALQQFWTRSRSKSTVKTLREMEYFIRQEGSWAYGPWAKGRNPEELRNSWQLFRTQLMALLQQAHRDSTFPDEQLEIRYRVMDLKDQRNTAVRMAAGQKVISLDPCIQGDIDLAVSRRFAVALPRCKPDLVERPDAPSLTTQIQSIPDGEYILFDDDIATGLTMRSVRAMLPERIKITRVCALTQRGQDGVGDVLDIMDTRDFLAGSHHADLY